MDLITWIVPRNMPAMKSAVVVILNPIVLISPANGFPDGRVT